MPLLFGQFADAVHKGQRRYEIRKAEGSFEMVVLDDGPEGNFGLDRLHLSRGKGGNAAVAWYAVFIGERHIS